MPREEMNYAWYGDIVVRNPRANVNMAEEIKRAAEQQRLEDLSDFYRDLYKPDWFVILAPLYPLAIMMAWIGLMALKISMMGRP